MNLKVIVKYTGAVLLLEGFALLLPLLFALYDKSSDWIYFLITAALVFAVSIPAKLIKLKEKAFYAREGFAIVAISWILVSFFGALPYFISGELGSFSNSFFESVSGFSTTGATIINNFDVISRPMLLWRNLTLWLGGIGILVFTIAIAPAGGGYASHIVKAETASPTYSRLAPKLSESSKIIYTIYIFLTVFVILVLLLNGLSPFDAILNGLSVPATGGFIHDNRGFLAYNSIGAELALMLGMFASGVNFTLFYYIIKRNFSMVKKNEELALYIGIIIFSGIIIAFNLSGSLGLSMGDSFKKSFFHVISILSTSGLTTDNISLWPALSKTLLFTLMFIGGSAGSTSGGLKCVRVLIIFKVLIYHISKIIHPRAISSVKLNGKPVSEETLKNVILFFVIYMFIYITALVVISSDGFDFETNLTAVSAALNTVGTGFGKLASGNGFAGFSALSKYIFSACMLMGRLEIYPVLLLFYPSFWKRSNI
ncbi:MAG: TrkH family potassium uptake protein [Lachnospiraceae bacterium]|nr:TrkH family potassium uptake protein [Lachnospiraceae bacterium]